MFNLPSPAQLDAAYRAAGGIAPHQVEALHAAALGRVPVPDAVPVLRAPHPAAVAAMARRVKTTAPKSLITQREKHSKT